MKMILVKNTNYKSNQKLSNLEINNNFEVKYSNNKKYMNAGVYLLRKKLIDQFVIKNTLENDILPNLIKKT